MIFLVPQKNTEEEQEKQKFPNINSLFMEKKTHSSTSCLVYELKLSGS
jgi:hypothetical protein